MYCMWNPCQSRISSRCRLWTITANRSYNFNIPQYIHTQPALLASKYILRIKYTYIYIYTIINVKCWLPEPWISNIFYLQHFEHFYERAFALKPCIYRHTYIYIYIYIHSFIYLCVCVQIHAYIYIYKVCSKTRNAGIFYLHHSPTDCVIQFNLHFETMYINILTHIYIYTYTFIYLCVCVQIHIYIYKVCSRF